MKKYRLTAVSYFNTIPFIYGIKKSGLISNIDLSLQVPSQCAAHLRNGQADIALVPVGAIPVMEDKQIVTNYCIGANGKVGSVFYIGNVPPGKCSRLFLDKDSMTSVRLAKVLFKEYWNNIPEYINGLGSYSTNTEPGDAAIVIGDKSGMYVKDAIIVIDLAAEWKKYCGRPFVFAVWMADPSVDKGFLEILNEALGLGVNNIKEALSLYHGEARFENPLEYLTKNIAYHFGPEQKEALRLFLSKSI